MTRKIITFIILLAVFIGFLFVVGRGLRKTERAECRKWAREAEIYPDYYLTDWQRRQCQKVAPETLTN